MLLLCFIKSFNTSQTHFLISCAKSPCNLCCNPPLFMLRGDMLGLVTLSRWRACDKGEWQNFSREIKNCARAPQRFEHSNLRAHQYSDFGERNQRKIVCFIVANSCKMFFFPYVIKQRKIFIIIRRSFFFPSIGRQRTT